MRSYANRVSGARSKGRVLTMAAMRPTTALAATLVALALALGACGGDDGDGDGGSDGNAVTKPEYVAEIGTICKKATEQSKPIFDRLQKLVDASGTYKSRLIKAAPDLRKLYKIQNTKLQSFKDVEPPTADTAQIAELTKVAQQTIDEFEEFLPAADSGDLEKFIDIATDASGARADAERLGTNYGLREDCFTLPVDLSNIQ